MRPRCVRPRPRCRSLSVSLYLVASRSLSFSLSLSLCGGAPCVVGLSLSLSRSHCWRTKRKRKRKRRTKRKRTRESDAGDRDGACGVLSLFLCDSATHLRTTTTTRRRSSASALGDATFSPSLGVSLAVSRSLSSQAEQQQQVRRSSCGLADSAIAPTHALCVACRTAGASGTLSRSRRFLSAPRARPADRSGST